MNLKCFNPVAGVFVALFAINFAQAQIVQTLPVPKTSSASGTILAADDSKSLNEWLMRMHESSKNRSYIGTYVVTSGGFMSSAKIWHVCEGNQQMERVETLSGAPRSVFRHNDRVVTFMPEQKIVRTEKRESLGLFPQWQRLADSRIGDFYRVKKQSAERVAGLEADVFELSPKDTVRFGYRVWTDKKKGLIIKLQTLDMNGQVLEQAAFSELQLDAPVKMDKLLRMMNKVDGYRAEQSVLVKTTAIAEGWLLKTPAAGFRSMSCYKRPEAMASNPMGLSDEPLQWIFSDGLASVSLFIEPFDRQRHEKPASMSVGATQTMTRQIGAYWLTAVGEVPMSTLRVFANGLERKQ